MEILAVIGITALALYLWSSGARSLIVKEKLPAKPWGDNFKPGDRVVIIGLPLSGKTYLAAKLTADVPRVVYFDPYMDYGKFERIETIPADTLLDNPSLLAKARFRYAITPSDSNELDIEFEEVTALVRAAGNCVYVMDEVGDYKRSSTVVLERLARNGRHDGIVPIYVSQVAMDIPKTVRRIASQVYSFRQEDRDDLEALAERYGEDYADRVASLSEHRYELWTMKGFGPSLANRNLANRQSAETQSRQSTQSKEKDRTEKP